MDRKFIYRSNGDYFGFILNGYLFDTDGEYLGWVEDDDSVWRKDGEYFGWLTGENYILHNPKQIKPLARTPKIPPMPPDPPMAPPPRMPRIPPMYREDALDKFDHEDESE